MLTLGMDLCSLSLGKPREKLHKFISRVIIFLLIGKPWSILYFPPQLPVIHWTYKLANLTSFSNETASLSLLDGLEMTGMRLPDHSGTLHVVPPVTNVNKHTVVFERLLRLANLYIQ